MVALCRPGGRPFERVFGYYSYSIFCGLSGAGTALAAPQRRSDDGQQHQPDRRGYVKSAINYVSLLRVIVGSSRRKPNPVLNNAKQLFEQWRIKQTEDGCLRVEAP